MTVAIAAGLLAAAAGATLAAAQTRPPVDPQSVERDLERLRRQMASLEERLDELRQQRTSLVRDWESADVQLALTRNQLQVLRIRLQVLDDELVRREAEVRDLEQRLAQGRRELSLRVVALYRMGPLSYARFLLAADNADEALAGYQLISRLAAQDRVLVASVRLRLEELARAVREMEQTSQRLAALRDEEESTLAILRVQQEDRGALIRRIDVEAAAGRAALETQQRSAEELERVLLALEPESSPSPDESATTAAGTLSVFESARGRLPWPGTGEVTVGFGRQRHPLYDTYTLSKGIEIGADLGAPVLAVSAGRVVFADWFKGYGLLVILDHGDDFYTLYGHLGTFTVTVGERLATGQPLGIVGDSGSLTGPSLYFEIRQGTEALNPLRWLQRR